MPRRSTRPPSRPALNEITFAVETPTGIPPATASPPCTGSRPRCLPKKKYPGKSCPSASGHPHHQEADEHGEFQIQRQRRRHSPRARTTSSRTTSCPLQPRRTEELIKAALFRQPQHAPRLGSTHDYFYDLCDEHGICLAGPTFACAYYDMENERFRGDRRGSCDNVKRL